jgi:actin-related protein
MNKFICISFAIVLSGLFLNGQENLPYQKPCKEILELVDVPLAPRVMLDENKKWMVFLYRDTFKTIQELSQPEINPVTHIGSSENYYKNIQVRNLASKETEEVQVSGLPENALLTNFSWSPDQQKLPFTNTTLEGVEVWILDLPSASARRLTGARVNADLRDVINWFRDGKSLLVKMVSLERKDLIDTEHVVPTGPTISVDEGRKAQNRTYQDLLQNKNDEHNFEQLVLSEIQKVSLDGSSQVWLESAMYADISFSPDGEYVMVTTLGKPFSYMVPY